MKVGMIIVGDELLNGSRQDKHMPKMIELLKQRGMKLSWVRIEADNKTQLSETFRQTLHANDLVFSFGGIGATPDDVTRECVANAAGVSLTKHPEAVQLIEAEFGKDAYPNRILMSYLPEGSKIIPNPVNRVPGFSFQHHHCVPGFPSMAWPMVEWVLDTHYQHCFSQTPDVDWRWDLYHCAESRLLGMMNTLLERFPEVSLSSLPSTTNRNLIDFGLKGQTEQVALAGKWLEDYLQSHQISFKRRADTHCE